MAAPKKYDLAGPQGVEVFRNLPVGARVKLTDGSAGEVVGNPRDGGFVLVKFSEAPNNPARLGQEDYVFFNEVREAE